MNFGNCCIHARKAHTSIRKFSKENLTVKVSGVIVDAHLIPMKFRTFFQRKGKRIRQSRGSLILIWDVFNKSFIFIDLLKTQRAPLFRRMRSKSNRVFRGALDINREKIETVRPFEPSSTVVHPCTTVEGEFWCVHQNIAALIGSQWFQTVSSFSSEKLEAKKCTRMYIF